MTHYFSDNKDLPHNYRTINFDFNGINFKFNTDSGVFSNTEVDFGTYVLLDFVKDQDIKGKVLDLGCGYGVISIVLSKFFDIETYGVDINSRAINLAKKNAKLNNVNVDYLISDCFSDIDYMFDEILVNPPIRAGKKVIYKMFNDSYNHLNTNGNLWVVIRKQQGASSAVNEIKSKFNNCDIVKKKKGFWILKATKY
ncbi:MAG: methyltransferase [Erysipelotrichaceae bacterium]